MMLPKFIKNWIVKSKRFQDVCEPYADEAGEGYRCRCCGYVDEKFFHICEKCFCPLPLVGGTKPK